MEKLSKQENFDKAHAKVAEQVEDLLSNPSIYRSIEKTISPHLKSRAERFVQENQDKASEYAANPELLIRDIEQQVDLFKYVKYLEKALDAALIASTILSIGAIIFSGGAATPGAAAAEMAKWSARKALKKYVRQAGKKTLSKIISKQALKNIAKLGLGAAGKIGKHFLQEAVFQGSTLTGLNLVSSIVKDVGTTTAKNIVAEHGTSTLKLPRSMVDRLVQTKDDSAFDRVLDSFKTKTINDLKRLFSTEQGFKNLAFGVALRKLWQVRGIKNKAIQTNMRANVHQLVKDPKYKNPLYLHQMLTRDRGKQQQSITDQQIEQILKKSQIPKSLQDDYLIYLKDQIKDVENQTEAEKIVEEKIQAAEILVDSIRDEIIELGTLDVLSQYGDKLNSTQQIELLEEILDQEILSLNTIFDKYQKKNIKELASAIRSNKIVQIEQIISRLALGKLDSKAIETLQREFVKQASLARYKQNLITELFND